MENLKIRVLTALKNQYIFEKMYFSNEHELVFSLQNLFKKYNPAVERRIVFPLKQDV